MSYKLLLVDDEQDILEFISYNLKNEGYQVLTANNGQEGLEIAKKEIPDLILLDVMMPKMDGMETCIEMRKEKSLNDSIIVFLTARSEDYSMVAGLDAGGDDYISKPIKPRVLVAKINSLLRRKTRTSETEPNIITSVKINRDKYVVEKDDKVYTLPKKEFELLALLISKPGNVFTREAILRAVWDDEVIVGDRTIDVHIRKLREKLGDDIIKTIKGVGYKFEDQ
jgi:two-component system, OmpR family, alkaline phosphatase synthesis response regulator PhoP